MSWMAACLRIYTARRQGLSSAVEGECQLLAEGTTHHTPMFEAGVTRGTSTAVSHIIPTCPIHRLHMHMRMLRSYTGLQRETLPLLTHPGLV
jgi:hypothetical protein